MENLFEIKNNLDLFDDIFDFLANDDEEESEQTEEE